MPIIATPDLGARLTWRMLAAWAGIAVVAGGLAVWSQMRASQSAPAPAPVIVSGLADRPAGDARWFALAPDGRFVAFVRDEAGADASGMGSLRLFDFATSTERPLTDATLAPRAPFVSVDGDWIGFLDAGNIMRVRASGGTPERVCDCGAVAAGGAAWLPDGSIVYAHDRRLRLRRSDGTQRDLTRPQSGAGSRGHVSPTVLSNDRVLYTMAGADGASEVRSVDLKTGTDELVLAGAVSARFVPPDLFVHTDTSGAVHLSRFVLDTRRVGRAIVTAPLQVRVSGAGAALFDIATNGTVVYAPAGGAPAAGAAPVVIRHWLPYPGWSWRDLID